MRSSTRYEKPLAPFARRWLAKQNARAMERLKAQLEQGATTAAA